MTLERTLQVGRLTNRFLVICIIVFIPGLTFGSSTFFQYYANKSSRKDYSRYLQGVSTQSSGESALYRALESTNGQESFTLFTELLKDKTLSSDQKVIVNFHLWSYAVLLANEELQRTTVDYLRKHPSLSESLFSGPVPDFQQFEESCYIQIGAFSTLSRAEKAAASLPGNKYTTVIDTLKRPTGNLYAVRLGGFRNNQEARQYGSRHFGRYGKDFTIVER